MFGLRGRPAGQRLALDLLADPSVGIVSLGGPAGTGKSVLALAAGLDWVLERNAHRRVVVFRPLFAVGGQDLGFLPGSESEKMAPWAAAVSDALESIAGPAVVEHIKAHGLLEVLPLTHIRGRSLVDTCVIILVLVTIILVREVRTRVTMTPLQARLIESPNGDPNARQTRRPETRDREAEELSGHHPEAVGLLVVQGLRDPPAV